MISLRRMTGDDIVLGMRLKEQAGWNQTAADWQRCLELQPDGCFVAEYEGTPAGTVTTCIFGSVAWIAMVLVDVALRGRGIGRALLDRALTFLDEREIPSIRLDATPLGRPLYQSLGFVEEYTLIRHEGVPASNGTLVEPSAKMVLHAMRSEHQEGITQLDRQVTNTDRQLLLRRLFDEVPDEWYIAIEEEDVRGFVAARPGSRAWQIGPCLAIADAGQLLLAAALRRHAGQRVFVDVPADNRTALAVMQAAGLVAQRPLYRMGRGVTVRENVQQLWSSFGPEKG
jgi:GNAT superfamily N-acetyltransferase